MAIKQKIRKAVIPCAGFGTRFLPATKASPKEMLPVVDKPMIQYIAEEAVFSGIEEIILITGSNKRAIEDHFDYNFELEELLKRSHKHDQYREIREISDMAKFVYVRQKQPLGNGHAVLQAKEVVGNEPFVVVWGDELYQANPPRIKQLIEAYEEHQSTIISTFKTYDPRAAERYAVISGESVSETVTKVETIREKPGNGITPPLLVGVGGYVLTPDIFTYLSNLRSGRGDEIWLVDAITKSLESSPVYAYQIQNGRYYDCGNKLEYLKANMDIALTRDDMKAEVRAFMKEKLE